MKGTKQIICLKTEHYIFSIFIIITVAIRWVPGYQKSPHKSLCIWLSSWLSLLYSVLRRRTLIILNHCTSYTTCGCLHSVHLQSFDTAEENPCLRNHDTNLWFSPTALTPWRRTLVIKNHDTYLWFSSTALTLRIRTLVIKNHDTNLWFSPTASTLRISSCY